MTADNTIRTDVHLLKILFERTRFNTGASEQMVHNQVATTLLKSGYIFFREVRLGDKDRLDFLVHTISRKICIEVKLRGQPREILRQLERYAKRDQIDAIILLSAVRMGLPPEINGKPVLLASIGMGNL